jgi:hypothetical protein
MRQEFITFLKQYGVIGLAIAVIIGGKANALVTALVDGVLMPIVAHGDPRRGPGTFPPRTRIGGGARFSYRGVAGVLVLEDGAARRNRHEEVAPGRADELER